MLRNDEYTVKGRLTPDCQALLLEGIKQSMRRVLYPLQDTPLEITFKKFYHRRTNRQNRWLWGPCLTDIQNYYWEREGIAYTKEALYIMLRVKILGHNIEIHEIEGIEVITVGGKHFSQMNTVEFANAVDLIVAFYAERGWQIRMPKTDSENLITDHITDD